MMKFMVIAAKLQLNVHDLNNEQTAGNVSDIRLMQFLDEDGKVCEAPAVSGRMLKHWHLDAMTRFCEQEGISLCDGCKSREPIRPGKIEDGHLAWDAPEDESEALKNCAICDAHGFLVAQQGVSIRRTSRAMFSWLLPVLGKEYTSKQVLHTRVSQERERSEGEAASQMLFYKSYGSGTYGFVSALDAERLGMPDSDPGKERAYEDDELKKRVKAAINAYRLMLGGRLGASLSHAVPHVKPLEVVVAYSETGPLPFLVSPMYSGYLEVNAGIFGRDDSTLLYWGPEEPDGYEKVENLSEVFNRLFEQVGG